MVLPVLGSGCAAGADELAGELADALPLDALPLDPLLLDCWDVLVLLPADDAGEDAEPWEPLDAPDAEPPLLLHAANAIAPATAITTYALLLRIRAFLPSVMCTEGRPRHE